MIHGNGMSHIRIRYYDGLKDLKNGQHKAQVDLPRTLGAMYEGTPSFESVRIGDKGI